MYGSGTTLIFAMPILGFGYGCLWSLMPLLTSELIGQKSYGAKYSMLACSAVVGSAPLSRLVVPFFYEAYADGNGWCVGVSCFKGSLYCAGAFCLIGSILALSLDGSSGGGVLNWQAVTSCDQEE